MKLNFYRYSDDAKIPVRKHNCDSGADIEMSHSGIVRANETVVIPLGFGIEVPKGYSARLQVRTSVAMKGIFIQGCAIDAGYTGEISLILHNISKNDFVWYEGERLGYIEMYQIQYPEFIEKLDSIEEPRGKQKFGSTGK